MSPNNYSSLGSRAAGCSNISSSWTRKNRIIASSAKEERFKVCAYLNYLSLENQARTLSVILDSELKVTLSQ